MNKYIKVSKHKLLTKGVRSSFIERAEKALDEFGIGKDLLRIMKTELMDKYFKVDWSDYIKRQRKKNKTYYAESVKIKYRFFSDNRMEIKMWHQARLKVIPTAEHLYKINCSDNKYCIFDNNVETNEHLLTECKAYEILPQENIKGTNSGERVKELLKETNEKSKKRKIVQIILKKLKIRKTEMQNREKKTKDIVTYSKVINSNKYSTREDRIKRFKEKRKIVSSTEDVTKALVPYVFKKTNLFKKAKKRKRKKSNLTKIVTNPKICRKE